MNQNSHERFHEKGAPNDTVSLKERKKKQPHSQGKGNKGEKKPKH